MLLRFIRSRLGGERREDGSEDNEQNIDYAKDGKPPNTKRLAVVLSTLVFVIAGTPAWWVTTKIHRPILPTSRIESIHARTTKEAIHLPVVFRIFIGDGVLGEGTKLPRVVAESRLKADGAHLVIMTILQNKKASRCTCMLGEFPTLDCPCPSVSSFGHNDIEVDEVLSMELHRLGIDSHGNAAMFVGLGGEHVRVRVGAHRVSWMSIPESMSEGARMKAIENISETLLSRFYFGEGTLMGEKLPISATSEVLMSFTLCNSDPSQGYWWWEFKKMESAWIQPVVQALSPILDAEIESQVLYHTKTDVAAKWSQSRKSYILPEKSLPFFVNNEWQLDSGRTVVAGRTSQDSGESGARLLGPHVLHWIVFLPPPDLRPLEISDSLTNGFSIPSWGGVLILNKNCSCPKKSCKETCKGQLLSEDDCRRIASVFVAQLRGLLGLEEVPSMSREDVDWEVLLNKEAGFSGWEIDSLIRRKVALDISAAVHSLIALESLMNDLPNLEMPEFLGEQVHESLEAIDRALLASKSLEYLSCAASAAKARRLAEEAFSHPSILAQLNFPDQHKVAMYLPFFFPVGVALFSILVAEIKRYVKRLQAVAEWRKVENSKKEL